MGDLDFSQSEFALCWPLMRRECPGAGLQAGKKRGKSNKTEKDCNEMLKAQPYGTCSIPIPRILFAIVKLITKKMRVVVVEGFTAEPSLGRLSMLHIEFYVICETKIIAITSNPYYSPVQPYIHPRCFKAGQAMKLAVGQEPEP